MKRIERSCAFDGWVERYEHESEACRCTMRFTVYLPPRRGVLKPPVLYWLSGLTCNDQNFMTKAGAQRLAAELGLALVAPDTSPRGVDLPGEDDDWDFGSGAGFYVNATREPWSDHYNMYDYVVDELPVLVESELPVARDRRGVSGHSMGGHGALVVALRNRHRYASVSAFAPICAPTRCPWGEKAFSGYLGSDREAWRDYDASELLARVEEAPFILVDQGLDDPFLEEQLQPELLERAAGDRGGREVEVRRHAGYDHSYYFVASFIDDHLRHHARTLAQP